MVFNEFSMVFKGVQWKFFHKSVISLAIRSRARQGRGLVELSREATTQADPGVHHRHRSQATAAWEHGHQWLLPAL